MTREGKHLTKQVLVMMIIILALACVLGHPEVLKDILYLVAALVLLKLWASDSRPKMTFIIESRPGGGDGWDEPPPNGGELGWTADISLLESWGNIHYRPTDEEEHTVWTNIHGASQREVIGNAIDLIWKGLDAGDKYDQLGDECDQES